MASEDIVIGYGSKPEKEPLHFDKNLFDKGKPKTKELYYGRVGIL